MVFRRRAERRKAEEKARQEQERIALTWRAPASEAIGLKVDAVKGYGPALAPIVGIPNRVAGFESTEASRWSTADAAATKRSRSNLKLVNPFRVDRSYRGAACGIKLDFEILNHNREVIGHWKTMLVDPQVLKVTLRAEQRSKQVLRDSALFL